MTIEVEVLKRAKVYLEINAYFICSSLYRVQRQSYFYASDFYANKVSKGLIKEEEEECPEVCTKGKEVNLALAQVAGNLIQIIGNRIGEDTETLEDWLQGQGIPLSALTPERMRQHRLDWVDILIKEFS